WFRKLFRKPPGHDWGEAAVRFRKQSLHVVSKRWPALTIFTVVSHLGLYAVLLISIRFAGVTGDEVSWAQVLGVFAFGRLLTALPLTPGGLGVVELAYIGGLVLAGRHHTTVPLAEFKAHVAAVATLVRSAPLFIDHVDIWISERFVAIRSPGLTRTARGIAVLGSAPVDLSLRWVTILLLVGFRRWRHLLTFIAAVLVVGWF